MKNEDFEEKRKSLIRMRNSVLFSLSLWSLYPKYVLANAEHSFTSEYPLEYAGVDFTHGRDNYIKDQVQLLLDTTSEDLMNFCQTTQVGVEDYFYDQLLSARTLVGETFLNKIELKEEEILPLVLNHYHMSESDYNSLVHYMIEDSSRNDIHWNDRSEITKMYYMSSTIPNEKKLKVVLDYYGISYDDFMVYVGVVGAESKKITVNGHDDPCYVDATCVATDINGRTNSKKWGGRNVVYQVSRGRQYEVYYEGDYKRYMYPNHTGYQAALDVMYHNVLCKENGLPLLEPVVWLGFVANGHERDGIQVVPKGNKYNTPQWESDCIEKYVPTVDPSEMEFRMKENGEIGVLVPKEKVATPGNSTRQDEMILELKYNNPNRF